MGARVHERGMLGRTEGVLAGKLLSGNTLGGERKSSRVGKTLSKYSMGHQTLETHSERSVSSEGDPEYLVHVFQENESILGPDPIPKVGLFDLGIIADHNHLHTPAGLSCWGGWREQHVSASKRATPM